MSGDIGKCMIEAFLGVVGEDGKRMGRRYSRGEARQKWDGTGGSLPDPEHYVGSHSPIQRLLIRIALLQNYFPFLGEGDKCPLLLRKGQQQPVHLGYYGSHFGTVAVPALWAV